MALVYMQKQYEELENVGKGISMNFWMGFKSWIKAMMYWKVEHYTQIVTW